MPSRLVLGAGPTALSLLDSVRDGRDELVVVTADEHRAETLRSDGIAVIEGDQTDAETLAELTFEPETVLVAAEVPAANVAAAQMASEQFPTAFLLAYAGRESTPDQRDALDACVDRLIDPQRVIADWLGQTISDDGARVRRLQRVLRTIGGAIAIVTHDNPDPDAIASAVALGELAERAGCDPTICYYGDISHQENRAFVNLLEYDLENLEPGDRERLEQFDGFALVDHSRPGVNDQLPEDIQADIVIDHHPPRVPVEARFVDLRSGVGATSTLLVDYYRRFDVEMTEAIATGLLFGIRVDTKDFRREVSAEDFVAAAHLVQHADMATLQRIEDPSVSPETLSVIGRAITNREQEGSVLLSCVGELSDRDALAQAADQLLDLEGVQATMVYGVLEGTIYVSARARGADIDLGEALRDAFGQIGSAGGHADMAGAQITLGVLDSIEDRDESLHEIVRSVVNNRFLDAIEARSNRLLDVYSGAEYTPDEFTERPVRTEVSRDPMGETSTETSNGSAESGDDGDDSPAEFEADTDTKPQ